MNLLQFRTAEHIEALEAFRLFPADKILPRGPAASISFPTFRIKGEGAPFGRLTLDREIRGVRNVEGHIEILCRYGHAEKWYPRWSQKTDDEGRSF